MNENINQMMHQNIIKKMWIHARSILVAIIQSGRAGADDIEVPYTANSTLCATPRIEPSETIVTQRRSKLIDASALMHVLDHLQANVPS